jgi:NADPH:quinone reductase-like Zn-dependent oxidoreductase
MIAIYLVKKGVSENTFEFRDVPQPLPGANEVLIKVEYSGLNFADTLARRGMYRDAPPIPCVLGYDVSGTIHSVGGKVENLTPRARVAAFTRFGGYAEYVAVNSMAVVKIPSGLDGASATAIATQYCTAYYCSVEATNLHEGDNVLIHVAAGGVGTALTQYALYKKCNIFATAGSDVKMEILKKAGVQHPINYRKENYMDIVKEQTKGKGLDVLFDSLGGKYVRQGIKLLGSGGRIVCIGAAEMSGSSNHLHYLKVGLAFGFYHPAQFMLSSKSFIGVNMLRIADDKPRVLRRCLEGVIKLCELGVYKPFAGKVFPANEIAKAHDYLTSRASVGKIAIKW